ncbi:electron transport complex subunit RsxC [Vibrio hangzhouensis]|uniref:Ion-translocating oxidoreductase complex subunit C n=1 Tax=Vibrio hangzhouensis TaxID=462991 RepID=A0A1H5TFG1_9VIBR|nr:electron transport complex subunit RsxC [Vibrio hangzhouensis]SEF61539.1 electron transport complex protein RnfC [Vibrio hangzhouensis]
MRINFTAPFKGGIHPKAYKSLTNNKAIAKDFWPKAVYLSLQQRNGAMLEPLVAVGEKVMRGQIVAVGRTAMIAPLHAPVNGIVTDLTDYLTAHPSKVKAKTIVIRANQDRTWGTTKHKGNIYGHSPEQVIDIIDRAGIVGLGGAGFPTAAKLKFARQAKVHTLVINGGECEPYLTCDDLTMQEHAVEVIAGVRLMLMASGAKKAIVGIEDNKALAFERMRSASSEDDNICVMMVPSIYPMGSERHLIKTVTGVTIPLGSLSTSVGILVNNIATAQAVFHAVAYGHPLVSRIVTVSGKGIESAQNVVVPIGTPVRDIIAHCGGVTENTERLVFGGPMMGQVVTSPQVPIDKTVGGILALSEDEVQPREQQECIRCGQCVRACPMGLMPFQMAAQTRQSEFKQAQQLGVEHCLSCGACSYVCPSSIPLVQYFQHAKGAIKATELIAKKSAQAKALTEARKGRLAAELAVKKAAKAAKAASRKKRARAPRTKSTEEVAND